MTDVSASIVGYGESDFGKFPERNVYDLAEDAAFAAMARANIRPEGIDGFVGIAPVYAPAYPSDMSSMFAVKMAEHLGITPGLHFGATGSIGGASNVQHLVQASNAIARGQCETVLILGADRLATGQSRNEAVSSMSDVGHREFEAPFGPLIPSMYALAARKHMAVHGTTREQLAKIAAISYKHASMQPSERAEASEPMTTAEVRETPMVATPLTVAQCSLLSDGAAALILTSRDQASTYSETPVDIVGTGVDGTHESIHQMPDLTRTAAVSAGATAFEEAGITHEALDTIAIYDCFTSTVLTVLEDLGFCDQGDGGNLVESGALELDGKWPMNTHGGELAQAHPGAPGGMMHITEAVRQLRGEAGPVQIDDAAHALVHGNGGILSTHSVAILQGGT